MTTTNKNHDDNDGDDDDFTDDFTDDNDDDKSDDDAPRRRRRTAKAGICHVTPNSLRWYTRTLATINRMEGHTLDIARSTQTCCGWICITGEKKL